MRWGDPEFTRSYVKNMPHEQLAGFYYGPDGYILGKEFISTEPDSPRQLETRSVVLKKGMNIITLSSFQKWATLDHLNIIPIGI